MKWLSVILVASSYFAGAQEAKLRAGPVGSFGKFVAIRSFDCQNIYFVPRAYAIDSKQSSVLLSAKTIDGKKVPVIQLNFVLAPMPAVPAPGDEQAIRSWAAVAGSDCSSAYAPLAPYPSALGGLSAKKAITALGFQVTAASSRFDGSKVLIFEVNAEEVNLAQLIARLEYFRPEQSIELFEVATEIDTWIAGNYHAVATFAENHYTEKICTMTERCGNVLGFSKCSQNEDCINIPKVVQVFKEMQGHFGIELGSITETGASEEKLADMQAQLFSRMMMSLFREQSRVQLEGVTQVVLGELKRETSDKYFDRLTRVKVTERSLIDPMDGPSLAQFALPLLNEIYKGISSAKAKAKGIHSKKEIL